MQNRLDYSIKIFKNSSVFIDYELEWKNFERKLGVTEIFNTYDFIKIAWNSKKNNSDLSLFVVFLYFKNELKAVFPWLIRQKNKMFIKYKRIEFICQEYLADFCDIISEKISKEEYDYVLSYINKKEKYDIIFLQQISTETNLLSLLISSTYMYNKLYEFEISNSTNYIEYSKSYSASHKQNLRTCKNKIINDGLKIDFIVKQYEEEDLRHIEEMSNSKLVDNKDNIYLNPIKRQMILNLVKQFSGKIIYVCLNDKKVAYRLNIIYKNKKYCLDASFDRNYKQYSVGILSLECSLKDSYESKYSDQSEGWGDDFYKRQFSTGRQYLFQTVIKGNTLFSSYFYHKALTSMKLVQDTLKENKS